MGADTSQADPAAAPPGPETLSPETLCLQLGWSMQRLYRARPVPEPARDPLPDRLPGLSGLTRRERAEIDYDRALTCLTAIAAALSWPADQTPDLGPIRDRLDAFRLDDQADGPAGQPGVAAGEPGGADASAAGELTERYRQAVLDGHLAMIVATTGARATLGKSYSLGRALADTCRPSQSPADIRRGFDPYRLAQLRHDLNDLASVLPRHAAKAVGQSLTWWRDAVYLADDSPAGQQRRSQLGNVRTDAPSLRRPPGIANPKMSTAAPAGDMDALCRALPRQGELWRVVLTGEQRPLDLLTPGAYLDAALRAASAGRRLAVRTLMAAPKTTFSLLAVVTAILAGVLVFIHYSHASSGGKLAAVLITVGGYLVSLGRAAVPRLKSAVSAVEQPLFQAALDYVSAEAISVPPVGHPDASGWSRLPDAPAPGSGSGTGMSSAPGAGSAPGTGAASALAPAGHGTRSPQPAPTIPDSAPPVHETTSPPASSVPPVALAEPSASAEPDGARTES
jgi:hypothetical protein